MVLCFNRGNVGSSSEHAVHIRPGSDDLVMVGYYNDVRHGQPFGSYFVFACENGKAATTLKELGWEWTTDQEHGEKYIRFAGLEKRKWAVREKLEDVFPGIIFEGWERIF